MVHYTTVFTENIPDKLIHLYIVYIVEYEKTIFSNVIVKYSYLSDSAKE